MAPTGRVAVNVLGIETSCDETAAAVVRNGREVLSNAVYSQIARHQPYGGVVPEIASRAHVEVLPHVLQQAVNEAGLTWSDLDRIAVTRGPGLASSLLVGVSAAKALALRLGIPLVPVNHLEGHVCSTFLGDGAPDPDADMPLLVLLVSGGHSCLIHMEKLGRYRLIGQTLDDAAGEALDKGAKLLGLGYPGGPVIEKTARGGDPRAISFPRGRTRKSDRTGDLDPELCFSFSGLKTSLLTWLQQQGDAELPLPDVTASYQDAVVSALENQLEKALGKYPARAIACVGGVARNQVLRAALDGAAERAGVPLFLADFQYCTDNAAMIAAVVGLRPDLEPETSFEIRPSDPLGV